MLRLVIKMVHWLREHTQRSEGGGGGGGGGVARVNETTIFLCVNIKRSQKWYLLRGSLFPPLRLKSVKFRLKLIEINRKFLKDDHL